MNISPISNNERIFQAKFEPYEIFSAPIEYLKLFEEKTKAYPNLTLVQEEISRHGSDYFILRQGNEGIAHGYFDFTKNGFRFDLIKYDFRNMNSYINRLLEIFNALRK